MLYVLVIIEHQAPRIAHCNMISHPTAAMTDITMVSVLRLADVPQGNTPQQPAKDVSSCNHTFLIGPNEN